MAYPYLAIGQTLKQSECVVSPNHRYQLWQQDDGNLVLYHYPEGRATWHTNTATGSGNKATLQADGNFVVYDSNGTPIWAAASNRPNFKGVLLVTDDGKIYIEDVVADVTNVPARH